MSKKSLIVILMAFAYLTLNNQSLRHERTELQRDNKGLVDELRGAQSDLTALQAAQARNEAIDRQRSEELRNAENRIADLERDVDDGARRLQIAASCPAPQTSNKKTRAGGLVDAAAPRLNADAEQNYFRLRRELKQVSIQVKGLQDYIRDVCLMEE